MSAMDIDNPNDEESPYHSSSDSDFNDQTAADNNLSSSSDDDNDSHLPDSTTTPSKRKTKKSIAFADQVGGNNRDGAEEGEDAELASGDEAVVKKAQRKKQRKRKRKGGAAVDAAQGGVEGGSSDEDSGGEGGLVKTRSQRAKEKVERQKAPLASTAGSTIDVDAIWQSMINNGSNSANQYGYSDEQQQQGDDQQQTEQAVDDGIPSILKAVDAPEPASKDDTSEKMVTITRTYRFAGQVVTERKEVPASSAEGKLWLEEEAERAKGIDKSSGLWRPKRRANPFDISGARENLMMPVKGPKLNMVEKSKMDWAGFVDREGIKDQLDEAGRSKEGYLERMDFLKRVEAKREDEERTARLQAKG